MALNAHDDLSSVGALIHYLHAAAGFPVKSTWLAAIKVGNYSSWPGLTYANASKYCPDSDETIKGHLTQVRQGLRSTKPKAPPQPPQPTLPTTPSKEMHIWTKPISKLFTDDMGRFPVRYCSSNQYIMLAYHCGSNAILVEPFQSRADRHRIPAYTRIMSRLQARGHTVNHQVLDNECSAEYIRTITDDWKATYQLVPPDVHRRNLAEQAIQTFKAHFLSILSGLSKAFPNFLWDKLLHHRLSSLSTYFANQPLPWTCLPGNSTTRPPSTLMPLPSVPVAALSSYTTNPTSGHLGPSEAEMASTSGRLAPTTAASK
jgi:hypothetical protein